MTIVYKVRNGLYVNLTNRCPCACTFCIRQNGNGAYGSDSLWLEREPTDDEVIAAVDAANPARHDELVFCGYGEPTERLDTLLIVAHHVKTVYPGLSVRVNTNGLSDLINGKPTATRFAGLVDNLSISLNTASAEEYVQLCRPKFGPAAYPALIAFAREVRDYVPAVTMTVVATETFTDAKRKVCETICRGIGVPLRIRPFIRE